MSETGIKFEYTDYGLAGVLIDSIMSISSDSRYYWALYVDGKYAETSIDKYVVDSALEVKWVYEEIDFLKFS